MTGRWPLLEDRDTDTPHPRTVPVRRELGGSIPPLPLLPSCWAPTWAEQDRKAEGQGAPRAQSGVEKGLEEQVEDL